MSDTILVSTHDLPRAGALRDAFREEGYRVELVTPDEELREDDETLLLVLSGGAEAGGAGKALARQATERLRIPVIGYGRPGQRPGREVSEAFAPTTAPEEVALIGRTLVERRRLQRLTGIVGETDAIREALERVVQIAPVHATVLITGESGTGKELVARGIHALSPRRHKAFIAVNVAALPETLLESELFGHEKGAFTGAIDARKGLFQLADGGTIFLDEIGEMPPATQTKLLRVLEQREFLRVGGEQTIRVDVRILTATNQPLRQLVDTGDFRRDLYYRLNVLRIELPPLRERRDDIPRLVEAFIREAAERHDRPRVEIEPEAMEILRAHHWPGNVRELRNLVESMVVLAPRGRIRADDIPPEVRGVRRDRALVPVVRPGAGEPPPMPARTEEGGGEEGSLRPQLEFVFRTLVDLRMDVDDLRREFERYREDSVPSTAAPIARYREPEAAEGLRRLGPPPEGIDVAGEAETRAEPNETEGTGAREVADAPEGVAEPDEPELPEGVIVYRPGMTMEDLEREAIAAALREKDGNRREAAEALGIGERTLYRKIKRFDL